MMDLSLMGNIHNRAVRRKSVGRNDYNKTAAKSGAVHVSNRGSWRAYRNSA